MIKIEMDTLYWKEKDIIFKGLKTPNFLKTWCSSLFLSFGTTAVTLLNLGAFDLGIAAPYTELLVLNKKKLAIKDEVKTLLEN